MVRRTQISFLLAYDYKAMLACGLILVLWCYNSRKVAQNRYVELMNDSKKMYAR